MATPEFYQPDRIGELYLPKTQAATEAGAKAGVKPAEEDWHRVYLLLIDMQVDFIHPDGSLSVPGAVEDTRRTVQFIYDNAAEITTIGASLDSHLPLQIFSPSWWVDTDGNHPAPYTVIPAEAVKKEEWIPLYEVDWSKEYVEKLEETAKKTLMIWPYHTLIGTPGHTLVPAVYEAIAYHSAARQAQPNFITKGTIPKTEYYSAIEPEVKVEDDPRGQANTDLLDDIGSYDLIYIAGQAKSHCVLETVTSMMRYYPPEVISKLRVLKDGMSSVQHPEIDFDALADETFAKFEQSGLTLTEISAGIG